MTLTIPAKGQWAGPLHSIDNMSSWYSYQDNAVTSTAWGTQYRAVYVPVRVPVRCVVRKLGYASSTTATGNIDIGLYDASGVRLVSSGSTAKVGATSLAVVDVTDTTIGPGGYYIALNNDTTTDTFSCTSESAPRAAAYGLLTETLGSVVLPATATWIVNQTLTFSPVVSALLVTEVS